MSDLIKDLSELRLSYQKGELHEDRVETHPHAQFLLWFNHALEAQLHEPYAMSLATASAQGRPHVRTVLLREQPKQGMIFIPIMTVKKAMIWQKTHMQSYCSIGKSRNVRFALAVKWSKFLKQNRRTTIISVHEIVKLQHISVHHKVV
jgi:pyridoxine/pyridoxamine 5'-phosphate oxidase